VPGTTRKTPAKPERYPVPTSVEGLAAIVVELLEHVQLRDANERAVLHAKLTGEEVPVADEESTATGDGEG
jgi:hypothetical protein